MTETNQKRRKLRSSDSSTKNASLLYNFDNVNQLLHKDGRIRLDFNGSCSAETKYEYFGKSSWDTPDTLKKTLDIRHEETLLPRRRTKNIIDPLPDDVYGAFHRRMKKDEKSRTLTDRARMYFEMDNLKSSLELLQQHDWNKHLPHLTMIKDRNDIDELLWKRNATIQEIEKTLAKFSNWEARCADLSTDMKRFESSHNMALLDEDDDDSDESILRDSLDQLAKKRKQQRIKRYGRPMKIFLGNGHHIRYDPYLTPTVAVEEDSS
ncbi:hypothetical protein JCM33374_g3768 [Metschnikowia sp. JCM 33374]|nr:hypothetical protein JCM33374_g3768 [Metschnikowia sp. JCM 33374]